MSLPVGRPNQVLQPQPFSALPGLVKPGDFAGQSFWPGQKILPFPAQGESLRPGQKISAIKNVKSGPTENLPITTSLKPLPWNNQYDTQQVPSDLIFAGRNEAGLSAGRVQMISLGQLNEELRLCFLKFESMRNSLSGNAQAIIQELEKFGEQYFIGNPKKLEDVLNKRDLSLLYALSAKAICNKWNFLGVRVQQAVSPTDAGLAVTVQQGGPTVFTDVWNYWGNVGTHDNLFLVLTRRKDRATGEPREFQLQPVSSKDNYPTLEQRQYLDTAGLCRYGYVIKVGSVWQQPISYPAQDLCEAKAGLIATAAHHLIRCETLSIVVGPRGFETELYL